jgi:hypothetical protein
MLETLVGICSFSTLYQRSPDEILQDGGQAQPSQRQLACKNRNVETRTLLASIGFLASPRKGR